MKSFTESVEHVVATVEHMVRIMQTCPYTTRDEQIAVLSGFADHVGLNDEVLAQVGLAAIVMLMRERQAHRVDGSDGSLDSA